MKSSSKEQVWDIPKEAIDKAFEGGWPKIQKGVYKAYWQTIALDPSFWQSLGKALGWQVAEPYKPQVINGVDVGLQFGFNQWHVTASQFFDLILLEQPTEEFWLQILTPPITV